MPKGNPLSLIHIWRRSPSPEGFSSPSPIFISTFYRSVQLTQGSMLLTMTGMSASWQSFICLLYTSAQKSMRSVAVRCDLCKDWMKREGKSVPACVEACPVHARSVVQIG